MAEDEPTDEPTDEMPEAPDRTEPKLSAEDVRKMQASMRRANKEAETLRLRLREFEDAGKSELERLAGKLTETEARARSAEMALLRWRIGSERGLPSELVDRLVGDTEAEMAEDADRLASFAKTTTRNGTAVPQGPRGNEGPPDMNELIRQRAGRR